MLFLTVMLTLASPASADLPDESNKGTNWVYQTRSDPITDQSGGALQVTSVNGKARLLFVCDLKSSSRPMSIQYATDSYVGAYRSLVTIRFDKGEVMRNYWDSSGQTAFIYSSAVVRDLLVEFVRASTVVVRAEDEDSQNVDASFDLTDAKGQIERVMRSCGKTDLLPKR